jgi:type VI secretion system protein ImpL
MNTLIVRILKIALLLFLAVLLILMVFGLVLWLDWPLWVGVFLLLALAAIGVVLLFLMKIMARRREQRFVHEVIEQDEARLKTVLGKERDEMKVLQERWKEAVDVLRRSHLRKRGNPLYVLPWYMVIGESGSGKTTAINSAKLSSPFAEVKRVQGISGTKNCDWWFFEQAVIIDTAGRYAIPVDEGRDKDEWQKFLGLLLKYRRKEPLHGLIVTVAADKLLRASPELLESDGKNIRRRVDELMRVLGVKFPVYVLVTKCDLVQGMTTFSEQLPEKALDQPMGVLNQNLSKDVTAFLESAVKTISERLKNIRLLLLHHPQSKSVDPALLLFPEEFEQLGRGLSVFMKSAFQENPYQDTPILRGIFFSSGHQEGTPYSHFLEALGLIEEKQILPGTSKGLYLHKFFAQVLPTDRQLFAPTTRAIEWQRLTRNLGLTAWVLLAIAVCGLLSFSFVKNLNSIRSVTRELAQPPTMKGEFLADLATMGRFRETVTRLGTENRNWWIPRFGLRESLKLEIGLKEKFCKQFHDGFLAPFDRQLQEVLPKMVTSSSGSDELVGQYIVHLVRRINLLKARMNGATLESLQAKPQPAYISLLSSETVGPDIRKKFGSLYLSYISWRGDDANVAKEVSILQVWLKDLLNARGASFQWLIAWMEKDTGLPPITLANFWGGTMSLPDERRISPAFTRKGKGIIDAFLKEVETALADPAMVESQKANFDKRYRGLAFDTWQNFAAYFPRGVNRLKGAKEWQQMASRMATDQGAYLAFFNRIATELEPVAIGEGTPPWLQQIMRLQTAKAQGYLKDQGTVGKAAEHGKKLVAAIEKKIGDEGHVENIESQMAAGKAYQELVTALGAISSTAGSRNQAYQMAAQVFTEEGGVSKSPFYIAQAASARLKTNLGGGRPVEDVVARLISGPIDFLWTTTRMDAGCYLQTSWEEKVLAEAQGASGQQGVQMLLAPDGPVWKFVKGSGVAAPFIGWTLGRGYYAKEALGGSIPFDPSFFPFLVKGAKVAAVAQQAKPSFNVSITGMPTDANQDARIKPQATKLEMQCASGIQSLSNLNFPVKRVFTWAPETCGEVVFQIEVGNAVLTRRYSGPRAFPDFLQDFRGGRHVFRASDFPEEKAALDGMGIKTIQVNYQFSGEGHVIGQAVAGPGQVARAITRCWAE